jgi:hypothetical protein
MILVQVQPTSIRRSLSFVPLAPELTISFCSTAPTYLTVGAYAHIYISELNSSSPIREVPWEWN